LIIAAVDEALQRAEQALLRHAQLAADAPQLRAGAVEHVAAVADAAADLLDDVVAGLDVAAISARCGKVCSSRVSRLRNWRARCNVCLISSKSGGKQHGCGVRRGRAAGAGR
jgi:hypothetical protein